MSDQSDVKKALQGTWDSEDDEEGEEVEEWYDFSTVDAWEDFVAATAGVIVRWEKERAKWYR